MVNGEWRLAGWASAAAGEDAETVSSEVRTTNRLRYHFPGFVIPSALEKCEKFIPRKSTSDERNTR
jgi:hypothetical protein